MDKGDYPSWFSFEAVALDTYRRVLSCINMGPCLYTKDVCSLLNFRWVMSSSRLYDSHVIVQLGSNTLYWTATSINDF